MGKKKDKKFSIMNIEILVVIVLVAVMIIVGLFLFNIFTTSQKVKNLKEEANSLVKTARNAYEEFKRNNNPSIVTGNDGQIKGMCITLKGLLENDFLTKDYDNWDGYIVIEDVNENNKKYSIWLTDKDYVIDGYDSEKIEDLELDDGITKYENQEFSASVKKSFTGTSGEKGGTGSVDGTVLKKYEATCINEKID